MNTKDVREYIDRAMTELGFIPELHPDVEVKITDAFTSLEELWHDLAERLDEDILPERRDEQKEAQTLWVGT